MRSRSARLVSCVSTGWLVVFCSAITHLPPSPRAAAAWAAAPTCPLESPSSSRTLSTTTAPSAVALSTFCLKRVVRVEISALSALRRDFSAGESLAPARTNTVW